MKKILITLLVFLFTVPISAQAHTVLSSSNPGEGDRITEPLEEITLVFETQIEDGSTMSLKSGERKFSFEEIRTAGNKLQGKLTNQDMPNGAYLIQWSIVGADGHPIKGEVPFQVELETELTDTAVDDEDAVEEVHSEELEATTEKAQKSDIAAQSSTSKDSGLTTILLAVLGIIVAGMAYSVLKMKKSDRNA